MPGSKQLCTEYRGKGRGAEGVAAPPQEKRKREERGRGEERKKDKERGIKRERKLDQSFQEHVAMFVLTIVPKLLYLFFFLLLIKRPPAIKHNPPPKKSGR